MFINVKTDRFTPYIIDGTGTDESSLEICTYSLYFLHLSCRYCPMKGSSSFWKPLSFG